VITRFADQIPRRRIRVVVYGGGAAPALWALRLQAHFDDSHGTGDCSDCDYGHDTSNCSHGTSSDCLCRDSSQSDCNHGTGDCSHGDCSHGDCSRGTSDSEATVLVTAPWGSRRAGVPGDGPASGPAGGSTGRPRVSPRPC
jgi:hypothetical protein